MILSHRRIDLSPSAFKKHPQLFEAMKSSEDGTYKVTEHFAVWDLLEKRQQTSKQARCLYRLHPLKAPGFPWGKWKKALWPFCLLYHHTWGFVCIVGTSLTEANKSNMVRNGSAKDVQRTLKKCLCKYTLKNRWKNINNKRETKITRITVYCKSTHIFSPSPHF